MPIKPSNVLPLDELWAFGLAGVSVGAAAEAQFIHLGDHLLHAVGGFDLALGQHGHMADFGTYKQHGTGVLAGCHAGAAADA